LESAKPDLQSVFKKPGASEGRSLARARTTKWETLRCFLTPADGWASGDMTRCHQAPWPRRRSTPCGSRSASSSRSRRTGVGRPEPNCRASGLL